MQSNIKALHKTPIHTLHTKRLFIIRFVNCCIVPLWTVYCPSIPWVIVVPSVGRSGTKCIYIYSIVTNDIAQTFVLRCLAVHIFCYLCSWWFYPYWSWSFHWHCVIATGPLRPHFRILTKVIGNKPQNMNYAWMNIKLTSLSLEYYTDNIHTNDTCLMNGNKYLYISSHKSCFSLTKLNPQTAWIGTSWNRTFTI